MTSRPEGIEGAIAREEARAREAEDHLRELRRHNGGPPLEEPPRSGAGVPDRQPFDGTPWIDLYRSIHHSPDLFGNPTRPPDKDAVAVAEMDGKLLVGVNEKAPGYTDADWAAAARARDLLVEKYPWVMQTRNPGWKPNDSLFHAESTILLRAAQQAGGVLTNRSLEVHVDRSLCWSCGEALPWLGRALGNPVVTFVNVRTGKRRTMFNGEWIK